MNVRPLLSAMRAAEARERGRVRRGKPQVRDTLLLGIADRRRRSFAEVRDRCRMTGVTCVTARREPARAIGVDADHSE